MTLTPFQRELCHLLAQRRRGAITDSTRVIATHFLHNGGLLHEELIQTLLPHGIEVTFDGMVVRV
jgi:phosphoribosyl 1,2-cyclic phosphate phosphodiesterase